MVSLKNLIIFLSQDINDYTLVSVKELLAQRCINHQLSEAKLSYGHLPNSLLDNHIWLMKNEDITSFAIQWTVYDRYQELMRLLKSVRENKQNDAKNERKIKEGLNNQHSDLWHLATHLQKSFHTQMQKSKIHEILAQNQNESGRGILEQPDSLAYLSVSKELTQDRWSGLLQNESFHLSNTAVVYGTNIHNQTQVNRGACAFTFPGANLQLIKTHGIPQMEASGILCFYDKQKRDSFPDKDIGTIGYPISIEYKIDNLFIEEDIVRDLMIKYQGLYERFTCSQVL